MSIKFIAIGTSLGGLHALKIILSRLPMGFPIPIAIVIHRQVSEQDYLCEVLQKSTNIAVREAYDKAELAIPGVTIAPAGYHLLVDGDHYSLSVDIPLYNARPSIGVLFDSVADCFGPEAVGVLLTGGGVDGVDGLCAIKAQGGMTIVQDPLSAAAPELPKAAILAGLSDNVFILDDIGRELLKLNHASIE